MSLSGVIFDLDGTIGETFPMAVELIGSTIAEYGGPTLTAEGVIALFGPTEKGILESQLGERWPEAWESYLARYVDMHAMCPEPFPGMREIVETLHRKGVLMALVTGKTAATGGLSLEVFGLAGFFDVIAGGAAKGLVKADRIREITARWKIPTSSVAYVGDDPRDVREAEAAGAVSVAVAWSEFAEAAVLAAEQPAFLFTEVAAFDEWLRASIE